MKPIYISTAAGCVAATANLLPFVSVKTMVLLVGIWIFWVLMAIREEILDR